ncbi:3'-5' exonuclease [uncultured Oxalicibacterium sp.]|uniref:3'-5' exonuclease n=1 Tax=uncultured Oxalicibacterium sp. TaxID=1168540 RepID=UPI0025D55E38|nr:3'-5' exonuclease [uncultured Oxalicibacterium sp.]
MNNESKSPVAPTGQPRRGRMDAPNKEETSALPPFAMLPLQQVVLPVTEAECKDAVDHLLRATIIGFDTESRPVFIKGATDDGPHIVQCATMEKTWIFQLHHPACEQAVKILLASSQLLKVGFGLQSDISSVARRFGLPMQAVLDLNTVFRQLGYKSSTGLRAGVAIALNQGFHKAKSVSTTNWAARKLTDAQIVYAANDAYAALCVFHELNRRYQQWQHAMPATIQPFLQDR